MAVNPLKSFIAKIVAVERNFKPNVYQNYWLGVREPGTYQELLNTNDSKYGGYGMVNQPRLAARHWNSDPWPYALEISVPALSVMVLKKEEEVESETVQADGIEE